jgi:hypothetical protein
MEFEFDPEKSSSNKEKHGIDFFEAQELWGDPRHVLVPARSTSENRYAVIGMTQGKIWTCIFTEREENLRIISARRARHGEEQAYHHR